MNNYVTLDQYYKLAETVKKIAGGVGLEFDWDGTQLGVKREDEETYSYVDLKGQTGEQGENGSAATIAVGAVTTLAAGSSVTVTNSGTSGAAVFDFGIPKGADGTPRSVICGSSFSATVGSGQTKYFSFGEGTAYEPSFVMPCAGTIKNLKVFTSGAPGTGQNIAFTIMKNNTATALTATLTSGNSVADTTHSVSVSAGDRLVLRAVASASALANMVNFSFEFDPS